LLITAARPIRILYADDVRELRHLLRVALSRDGHRIVCVEDGLLASKRLTADPAFDLLITDHHMPNMNGLQLVTHVRELGFPGRILVFSSELSQAVAEAYARLNVDGMLYKPVVPNILRATIGGMFPADG
jgi:two-component system, chemotaxis family, chemotaxis protein CheY